MNANELRYNDFLELKWKKVADPLPEERFKAILTGMIGAGKIPIYANTLTTGLSSRKVKEALFREWGIYDIQTARQIIGWLRTEGSRELYRKYYPFIGSSATARECRQKAISTHSESVCYEYIIHPYTHSIHALYDCLRNSKLYPDLAFTKSNLPANIIAWDMSRLIWLARLCFDGGYISESKAWDYILDADSRIWKHYRDMERFFMGCLTGAAFYYGLQPGFEDCLLLVRKWNALYEKLILIEL